MNCVLVATSDWYLENIKSETHSYDRALTEQIIVIQENTGSPASQAV